MGFQHLSSSGTLSTARFDDVLSRLEKNTITACAYSTAWVARLGTIAPELGERARRWLRAHELPDGGWGTPDLVYHHERFVATLAVMVALAEAGAREDEARVERGRVLLRETARLLHADASGPTIGFEMITPTLLDEAFGLGILRPAEFADLHADTSRARAKKISSLPRGTVTRHVTLAHSLEMLGDQASMLVDMDDLQEENGSVGYAPAATAFFARRLCPGDQTALDYLERYATTGGAPYVAPIDNFELVWGLWNVLLSAPSAAASPRGRSLVDRLERRWRPREGLASCEGLSVLDGDATGLAFDVMRRAGRRVDPATLLAFEEVNHFRCYSLETGVSVSTNAHILGGFVSAGFDASAGPVAKILRLLEHTRVDGAYWFDKWNVSPYYPTGHAVINAVGVAPALVGGAVDWMLGTQRPDGSWGYHGSTAEETAYALQALVIAGRHGAEVPEVAIQRGADWLSAHASPPYPPLWMGKTLYAPVEVVRSAVASARSLANAARIRET